MAAEAARRPAGTWLQFVGHDQGRLARMGVVAAVQSCFTFWEYGDVTRPLPGMAKIIFRKMTGPIRR